MLPRPTPLHALPPASQAQRFILHPDFYSSQGDPDPDAPPRLDNDVALVFLDEAVVGVPLQQLADNGTVGRGRGTRWRAGRQAAAGRMAGWGWCRCAAAVPLPPLLSPACHQLQPASHRAIAPALLLAPQALEPGQALRTAGWGRVPGATALSPNPNTLLAPEVEAVDLEECRDW